MLENIDALRRQTAAVVIWYHPTLDNVKNIISYMDYVDKIYILDNSEISNADKLAQGPFGDEFIKQDQVPDAYKDKTRYYGDKIVYYSNGINEGIGQKLNTALEIIGNRYTYALLLDQDSQFSDLVIYKFYTRVTENREDNVVIYAPSYIEAEAARKEQYGLVDRCITSGSLLNVAYARKLQGFNAGLFIDEVDFEFCLRARKQGYKLVQFYDGVLMGHSLGNAVSFGTLAQFREHSPLRTYYIVRNRLYMAQWFPDYKWKYYGSIVKKLVKIVLVPELQ